LRSTSDVFALLGCYAAVIAFSYRRFGTIYWYQGSRIRTARPLVKGLMAQAKGP